MNIFDLAEKREKMMQQIYIELAQSSEHLGLKRIFEMLAIEEGKHVGAVASIKKEASKEAPDTFFLEVKNILTDIKKKKEVFALETDQIELYKKVREEEKESEELYFNEAKKEVNPQMRKILEALAQEEHKHYLLMNEIVEFVERPERWVESPEFSSLDKF